MIRLNFSPGESKFIPLADPEKGTVKILSGIAIDQPTFEEGRVTFNFRLKTDETLKMLKPDQVCQMLQISRTFLAQLVRKKSIRSYKFGRLRRFLLADVIDYLTRNEITSGAGGPKKTDSTPVVPRYNN